VGLPRPFDALERQQELAFAGGNGKFFDGVAIAIAAAEVHPPVNAGGIALQHLFDEADALEKFTPVERRDQAQAADEIRHAGLFGGLSPSFGANRVFNRRAARRQRLLEMLMERRGHGA
jgi:hypothetical protein